MKPHGKAATAAGHTPTHPWHALEVERVEALLETGSAGLDPDEAARRLDHYGPNEVEAERPTPIWRLLLHQFQDPLIYILLIAAAVTLVLRDYTDSGVILAVVLVNAVIGFVQELRAREAIRGLARLSAPRAEVLRGGHTVAVDSRELVPGDVVVLTSGVRVPADLRLSAVRALEVDESMLTGESVPTMKQRPALPDEELVPGDQLNLAFAGTVVTRGRARGIVVRTGAGTELGRIAASVRRVGTTVTPLQEKMERFGRKIGVAVLALSGLVVLIGMIQNLDAGEIFLTAVALAVSAIPEGLPVVLTVTLAIGVGRMARRNAIVRALPAVETLGSTTVIGSDKTGTLTRNQMTVRVVAAGGEVLELEADDSPVQATAAQERALLVGLLANEAVSEEGGYAGDPTEIALLAAGERAGLEPSAVRARHAELDLLPFEPERRFMATLNRMPDGTKLVCLKGAPEVILPRCGRRLAADGREVALDPGVIEAEARPLTERGLRVLAMAYGVTDAGELPPEHAYRDLVFAGLQGMEDPVRPEAVEAVAAARRAGIRVLMLTGDHVETARAVGRQLGLGGDETTAVEGRALDQLSDGELDHLLSEVSVYARVAPEHKLRLVERLKDLGEVVAVTGDGVNDAPALRAAHIGVAMGLGGTDVAREAADIVLSDDNFATITAAVEEGRTVFSNTRKVAFFLLSTAVGEVITILAALLMGWPLPFLAAQILWINLVTNGLQDVALAFEPGEPGLLDRPPRPQSEGIVTLRILERLGAVGAVLALGTLGVFWWTLETTGDLAQARTVAMTQMVAFQFFHVFNSRSLDRSVFRVPLFSNPFLFVSIVAAAAAHLAVLEIGFLQTIFRTQPLTLAQWGLVFLVGSSAIVGGELDKWRNRRRGTALG
jgi:calcium-translocating P-type ATPase